MSQYARTAAAASVSVMPVRSASVMRVRRSFASSPVHESVTPCGRADAADPVDDAGEQLPAVVIRIGRVVAVDVVDRDRLVGGEDRREAGDGDLGDGRYRALEVAAGCARARRSARACRRRRARRAPTDRGRRRSQDDPFGVRGEALRMSSVGAHVREGDQDRGEAPGGAGGGRHNEGFRAAAGEDVGNHSRVVHRPASS